VGVVTRQAALTRSHSFRTRPDGGLHLAWRPAGSGTSSDPELRAEETEEVGQLADVLVKGSQRPDRVAALTHYEPIVVTAAAQQRALPFPCQNDVSGLGSSGVLSALEPALEKVNSFEQVLSRSEENG
jgi:hypothetical protein